MVDTSPVEVRQSKFGRGLFAKNNISIATILCDVTGPKLCFQETILLGERESHCLQIDRENYILCEPPFLFSNHSCQPNCALTSQLQLIALRNISQHEELFWDYSTSMLERHWTMECCCGTTGCRKRITDFDLLPQTIQDLYLNKGIVLPFIIEHMQNFSKPHLRCA